MVPVTAQSTADFSLPLLMLFTFVNMKTGIFVLNCCCLGGIVFIPLHQLFRKGKHLWIKRRELSSPAER